MTVALVVTERDSVDTERLAVLGGPTTDSCPSRPSSTGLVTAGGTWSGAPPSEAPVPQRTGDSRAGACSASVLLFTKSNRSFQGSHAELSREAHDGRLALALRPHSGVRFMMASLRREVACRALVPLFSGSSGSPTTMRKEEGIPRFSFGGPTAGEGRCGRRRSLRTLAGGYLTNPPGVTLDTALLRGLSSSAKAVPPLLLLRLLLLLPSHHARSRKVLAILVAGLVVLGDDGGM